MTRQLGWFGLLLVLLPMQAIGQELIPNGGFETFQRCPNLDNLLEAAAPWYNPNKATPDFYHQCFPTNAILLPPRTGQGLGRLFMDFAWAEYMATPLKEPLKADEAYQFELYIASPEPSRYPVSSFGAYFSNQALSSADKVLFANVKPQFLDNSPRRMPRALQWEQMGGCFVAKGGESHVTIGNYVTLPGSLGLQLYYLFIDDVSLKPIRVNIGNDTTLCGRQSTLRLDAKTPGATDYRWSTGSTSSTLLVGRPGAYWVEVKTPCKILRDTIQVRYALDFSLGPDTTLCTGETLSLSVAEPGTYRWQDGSTQNRYTVRQAGRYRVQVENATCLAADTIEVRYLPRPQIELGLDKQLCGLETHTIAPTFANGTFRWLDAFPDTERTVGSSGTYRAVATNACATTRDSVLVSYGDCGCVVVAPDAFSPNADGLNDTFQLLACGDITLNALTIFNRWGDPIFYTTQPPFRWDGTYLSAACQPGVYSWQIEYTLQQPDRPPLTQRVQRSLLLLR
jgi:gliding motility-associated-like protein